MVVCVAALSGDLWDTIHDFVARPVNLWLTSRAHWRRLAHRRVVCGWLDAPRAQSVRDRVVHLRLDHPVDDVWADWGGLLPTLPRLRTLWLGRLATHQPPCPSPCLLSQRDHCGPLGAALEGATDLCELRVACTLEAWRGVVPRLPAGLRSLDVRLHDEPPTPCLRLADGSRPAGSPADAVTALGRLPWLTSLRWEDTNGRRLRTAAAALGGLRAILCATAPGLRSLDWRVSPCDGGEVPRARLAAWPAAWAHLTTLRLQTTGLAPATVVALCAGLPPALEHWGLTLGPREEHVDVPLPPLPVPPRTLQSWSLHLLALWGTTTLDPLVGCAAEYDRLARVELWSTASGRPALDGVNALLRALPAVRRWAIHLAGEHEHLDGAAVARLAAAGRAAPRVERLWLDVDFAAANGHAVRALLDELVAAPRLRRLHCSARALGGPYDGLADPWPTPGSRVERHTLELSGRRPEWSGPPPDAEGTIGPHADWVRYVRRGDGGVATLIVWNPLRLLTPHRAQHTPWA